MEIELITTKKKLTRSLINQMREASTVALKFGTSLGYLINIRKDSYRAILIKYDCAFFIIPGNYVKGETSVYRKIGTWSQSRKFDDTGFCDSWWSAYQERMKEAVNQIYI